MIVRPKKAFVEWVNGYDDSKIDEKEILGQPSVYLVDDLTYTAEEDITRLIKKHHKKIFINEAFSWYEDKNYLPKNITLCKVIFRRRKEKSC